MVRLINNNKATCTWTVTIYKIFTFPFQGQNTYVDLRSLVLNRVHLVMTMYSQCLWNALE